MTPSSKLPLLCIFLLLPALRAQEGAGADAAGEAQRLIAQLELRDGPQYWSLQARLEDLGKEAVPVLRGKLKDSGFKTRLACAKALLSLGETDDRDLALSTLEELARESAPSELRLAALEILGENGDPDAVLPVLQKAFEDATDPSFVIPLGKALWDLDRVASARDRLVSLLESQDFEVKKNAALTLAEMDYFDGGVREVLRNLKRQPTLEGRRAALLDRLQQLSRQLDRGIERGDVLIEGADPTRLLKLKEQRILELEDRLQRAQRTTTILSPRSPMDSVLDEVLLQIQKSYVEEGKTDRAKLLLGAIHGAVGTLDPFSSFFEPAESKSFKEGLAGAYAGIGAQIAKTQEGGPLEILKPIYGGPAFKSGLHTGDLIVEIDGSRTEELEVEGLSDRLKGAAGSRVALKILRRGWTEPRTFEIERQIVQVPSVYSDLLPGKLGYVQLTQFGEKTYEEVVTALDDLEKQGMAGLIMDLRNNGGGFLETAKRIVDDFVSNDKLPIVTKKGRGEPEESYYPDQQARPPYPMVVLINQRSASASEIVAGALKDFGRATLVGRRTYGKGSVQKTFPFSRESQKTLGGEAQLKLTVQYYFLPLGRCVHTIRDAKGNIVEQGGVPPDIEVLEEKIPAGRLEERERLRTSGVVLDYVDKNWDAIKGLFAEGDRHAVDRYPGFAELLKSEQAGVLPEDLRFVLRYHVRRRLEDERGKELACDVQEDVQLQRAVLELLQRLGVKPQDFPPYAGFEPRAEAPAK